MSVRRGYPQTGETHRATSGSDAGSVVAGMGVVFEALDVNLQPPVALKVIADSRDLAEDEAFRARFTREAQAQASLDSPHVVQVYAHGEDDGRLWIATQLIPDGDLRADAQPSTARRRWPRRSTSWRRSRPGWPPRTRPVWCTATSSRPTCCCAARARLPGLPRRLRHRPPGRRRAHPDRRPARRSARRSYMAPELHTGGDAGVRLGHLLAGLPALGVR